MSLHNIRSIHLPYCLKIQPCGCYVVLNREYKPLGWNVRDYVHYGQHPILLLVRITPKTAERLSYNNRSNTDTIKLYNDDCVPDRGLVEWESYSGRLSFLASLVVDDGGYQSNINVCIQNLFDAAGKHGDKATIAKTVHENWLHQKTNVKRVS